MKIFIILSTIIFVPSALCLDISEGFECVNKQESAVASLSKKLNDFQQSSNTDKNELQEVIEKYNEASEKTKKMIDTTIKVIQEISAAGANEIAGDDANNADMLYCSTINAVREILILNEELQNCVTPEAKNKLEDDVNELKKLLK